MERERKERVIGEESVEERYINNESQVIVRNGERKIRGKMDREIILLTDFKLGLGGAGGSELKFKLV